MDNFVYHQILSFIPAILIRYFWNNLFIFFPCITFFNVICNCLSLFSFNRCHCYYIIILRLLVDNIVIFNRFNHRIQVFLIVSRSSSRTSVLHLFCKGNLILHNSTSIGFIKFQALLFCIKLLFSIRQAIDIFIGGV